MREQRLLDLFCGAGGCSVGYSRAGFDVVGVDINPQPNYPFEFIRADALEVLAFLTDPQRAEHYEDWLPGAKLIWPFDAIHASPPCQDYSKAMRHLAKPQPRLIEPVREMLVATGLPWVIENVVGAPIPHQSTFDGRHGVELCGSMFGLRVYRHRLFECSFPVEPPRGCNHLRIAMNPHNQGGRDLIYKEYGRRDPEVVWRREMGVEWMNKHEGREAIPPAYTEYIGGFLMAEIEARRMAA